jgi:sec-independent protein translocase protein TatC
MSNILRRTVPGDRDDDPRDGKMGFLEHLDELRKRIIRSCLAIAAGMLVAFFFVDRIADFVLEPTYKKLPAGSELVFIRPGEAFSFYMNVAFIAGIVLAAPLVMYQVWMFIAPGLYAKEKKLVVPFVVLTTIGTLSGALFSHYVLYPAMVSFFGTFSSPKMRFMPRVEDTIDLYLKMVLGMVVVFQIPTVVFFLAKMGLVTARLLRHNIKYAILGVFIVAAVLTPSTDPWNQIVFALPMIALYLLSIVIAWMVQPGESARREKSAHLRLVFAAAVIDQASRSRRPRSLS